MSDAPMNHHEPAGSPQGFTHPPLDLLREAREARGLHIAILSTALKVPVRKLEALEAGRYDELPGLTFARALALSACRHLKIDPEPILAQIPLAASPLTGAAHSTMDTPFTRADETRMPSSGWLSRPALLVAAVLVVSALLVSFWPQGLSPVEMVLTEVSAPAAPQAPATDSTPTAVTEPVVAPTPAAPQANPAELATDAATLTAAAPPATPAAPPLAATTAGAINTAPIPGSVMSIRATSESWVEVSQASGTVLLRRLLREGEVVNFSSPPPYAVLLGRAEAAEVTVRGQRFDTAAIARNSVARFEVK
jgi:cytoskeleton protein RodZ